jgi:hypothetical protein
VFERSDGKLKFYIDPRPPREAIERCLPPPGEYHDTPSLANRFSEIALSMEGDFAKCTCCWRLYHDVAMTKCKECCEVCDEKTHNGQLCPMLYLEHHFWAQRRIVLRSDVQIQPTPEELAYLIIAGVFLYKPKMNFWDPLVVNKDHPAVRKFYAGKQVPRRLGKVSEKYTLEIYEVYAIPPPPQASSTLSSTSNTTTRAPLRV